MNRLRDEVKVVPGLVWVFDVCLCLALVVFVWRMNPYAPLWMQLMLTTVMPLMMFFWVAIVGYVYGDARRRGMRHWMWTLLAALLPNAIGIILYFILRDPLPQVCPACGRAVSSRYQFCSGCGAALGQTCAECHRTVESGWTHCAHCGAVLQGSAGFSLRT